MCYILYLNKNPDIVVYLNLHFPTSNKKGFIQASIILALYIHATAKLAKVFIGKLVPDVRFARRKKEVKFVIQFKVETIA